MTQIIPTAIIENYLKHDDDQNSQRYEKHERAQIAKLFETLTDTIEGCSKTRRFVIVTGSQGAGKTHLANRLIDGMNKDGFSPLHIDAEEIIKHIPAFNADRINSQQYAGNVCDIDAMREALHDVTSRWRPAGKYIADRLINEAARRGVDVVYETTGQAEHFDTFLKEVHKSGYSVDAHACQARLSVKIAAFERRAQHDQDIYFLPEEIEKTHQRVLNNMAAVATFSNALTLYWRDKIQEPALAIARMEGPNAFVINSEKAIAYDEYMRERKAPGIGELADINGANNLPALVPAMASAPSGFVAAPSRRMAIV